MIAVDDIDYLRSDDKYTRIAWRGDEGKPGEALIRTPLKELVGQLDPAHFAQVHRAVVVNLHAISHVTRGDNETATIHLKGRNEVLPVSRTICTCFARCRALPIAPRIGAAGPRQKWPDSPNTVGFPGPAEAFMQFLGGPRRDCGTPSVPRMTHRGLAGVDWQYRRHGAACNAGPTRRPAGNRA